MAGTPAGRELLKIETGVWGGGVGLMDTVRALMAGKSGEEALEQGIKSGVITAGMILGAGAVASKIARLNPKAAPARMMGKLMDSKTVQDVDDIAGIARQEGLAARKQAVRSEWQLAGDAADEAKGIMARRFALGQRMEVAAPTVPRPHRVKVTPAQYTKPWTRPPDRSLGAADISRYQGRLARFINYEGEAGPVNRTIARYIQDGRNLLLGRRTKGEMLNDFGRRNIGGGRKVGESVAAYRLRVERLDGDLRRAITARHRILSEGIVRPPGTQQLFELPGQMVDDAVKVLDDIMPSLSAGEQRVVEQYAQALTDAWKLAEREGTGLSLVKGYFARMLKKPPNIAQAQHDKTAGAFIDQWLNPASIKGMKGYNAPGFFRRRMLDSWDEFIEKLEAFNRENPGANLEAVTDPVEMISRYHDNLGEYLNWWRVVKETSRLVDKAGEPLISPVPRTGWRKLLHPSFSDMMSHVTRGETPPIAAGKPIFGQPLGEIAGQFAPRAGVYAHPDVAKVLNAYFAPPTQRSPIVQGLASVMNYYKQFLFWNPMIHGKNLFSDFLDEFNARLPTMIKKHRDVGKLWANLDDAIVDAADHGLEITGRWSLAEWAAIEPGGLQGRIAKFLKPLNSAAQVNQHLLFDLGMRRAQLATWFMKADHLAKKYPEATVGSVKRAAAHFVNDLYGALPPTWFTRTAYEAGTWALLSRNWTISNLDLVMKAAFKKGLGTAGLTPAELGMIRGEYAKHIGKGLFGIVMQAELLTYGATTIFTGKPRHIWEYPVQELLSVHTGETDSAGREIQFPMPLFNYIKDIVQWIPGTPVGKPREVMWNKAHPIWKLGIEATIDYSSWQKQQISPYGATGLQKAAAIGKYVGEGLVPPLRPAMHVITGSPQPGITEPRVVPLLAYLSGGYVKHGRRGAAADPKLFDSMANYRERKGYERTKLDERLDELIAKGDYGDFARLASEEGRYVDDKYIVQRIFNYLAPTMAMWQSMRTSDRNEWLRASSPDERARLQAILQEEAGRARVIFATSYRRQVGEWSPLKEETIPR